MLKDRPRIAHYSLWSPNRSGLHMAVVDQIKYERLAGLDSLFINCDVEDPDPNRFTEDGITAVPWREAESSDVWVLHRSIPGKLMPMLHKKKSIAVLHGTSEILMLHEIESAGKNDKFNMHLEFMDQFQKVVTITKNDTDIMKQYDNGRNKVVYIPDSIDLEKYSLEGHAWDYKYRPAIISTTNIRINKNPAPLFWAMPRIIELIPTARLNVYGINLNEIITWKNIVLKSGKIGTSIENIHGQFFDLRPFLRGADIGFNSNYNGIFSRDSMEQMASGCSVVAYTSEHTPYVCERTIESIAQTIKKAFEDLYRDPEGQILKNRKYAEDNFCMKKAVKKYIDLYNML